MRSYLVKENPIDSAFIEILRYNQTRILLLYYKDSLKPPQDQYLYTLKTRNPIGSGVTEILSFKQTDIILLCIIGKG